MKKALKLALEALMDNEHYVAENERHAYVVLYNEVIEKCKAALAQPVQEPVGVFCEDDDIGYVRLIPHQQMKLKAWDKLYTTPPAAQPAQEPWCMKMNGCTTKCEDCPDEPAQQCLDCGSNNIGIPATYDSLIDSVKTLQASA